LPNRNQRGPLDKPFHIEYAFPAGRFSLKQDYDYQFVFVSLALIRRFTELPNSASAIEIRLQPAAEGRVMKEKLKKSSPIAVVVSNKDEQNASFFKLMNIEKWISYAVVSLTLILVSFNLICALWMIVLDKRKDISVLQAMGATTRDIHKIFLKAGWMICATGTVMGILMAIGFYVLQVTVGIVPVPEGFVVDRYPIEMKVLDI